jgi:hypothetical protein
MIQRSFRQDYKEDFKRNTRIPSVRTPDPRLPVY